MIAIISRLGGGGGRLKAKSAFDYYTRQFGPIINQQQAIAFPKVIKILLPLQLILIIRLNSCS